jgi:hypothetical protein
MKTGLVVIAWVLLVGLSLAWNIFQGHRSTIQIVENVAKANVNKDLAFRSWVANHGGVYVTPNEKTPPNPYLKNLPERDLTTTSGKRLTLINPAYSIRQVMAEYEKLYGIKGHITSLKLLNPKNKPDAWEREALMAFEGNSREYTGIQLIDNQPHMRHMLALETTSSCLKCHGDQGYKVGDVRGGVSVAIPMTPYLASMRTNQYVMFFSYGIFF